MTRYDVRGTASVSPAPCLQYCRPTPLCYWASPQTIQKPQLKRGNDIVASQFLVHTDAQSYLVVYPSTNSRANPVKALLSCRRALPDQSAARKARVLNSCGPAAHQHLSSQPWDMRPTRREAFSLCSLRRPVMLIPRLRRTPTRDVARQCTGWRGRKRNG